MVAGSALVAAGCGSSDSSSTGTQAASSAPAATDSTTTAASAAGDSAALPAPASLSGKTIAYIQTGSLDYFDASRIGAEQAVKALGGKFVAFNSDYKPQTELSNVQDAVARGVDGILLFSISRGTLESSARLAKQANIPVVDYYGYTDGVDKGLVDGWVGSDAYLYGKIPGEEMAKALGDCAGCEVADVQGELGRGDVEGYHTGFKDAVTKAGLKLVASPTSHWSRQEAFARMQELLQKYPNLKGVYCHNDDTTVGCVQALRQAGKKPGDIKLVTENASPTGLQLVKDGWVQADVGSSPAEESTLAAHMLSLSIAGQQFTAPVPCNAPYTVVTKDNTADAAPWRTTEAQVAEWVKTSQCSNGKAPR
jgi:ribose transport system substrate-binding protein